jgi:hypothetical protein
MTDEEHTLLALFVAAAQFRTRSSRDHHAAQWANALEVMDDMAGALRTASPEQRKAMASLSRVGTSDKKGMTREQVRKLAETPLQVMMPKILRAVTPVLVKMNMLILYTDDPVGFITSDAPVTWCDPEAYQRPPFYRAPGLASQSIEVTMPLSPKQCVIFAWECPTGYMPATEGALNELNRRHRFHCSEHYVVRSKIKKDYWFQESGLPDDAWDNEHVDGPAVRD